MANPGSRSDWLRIVVLLPRFFIIVPLLAAVEVFCTSPSPIPEAAVGKGMNLRGIDSPEALTTAAEKFSFDPRDMQRSDPAEAELLNASIPVEPELLGRAAPYRFGGDSTARERALECLAAAALYEAGSDADGQRAVIQVVLNRARHPAYSSSICAVVFQGADRASGCQFTFTCDGSLRRRYTEAAWSSARKRAEAALNGYVYRPVGLATHYHTSWVHPPWSTQLAKVASLGGHVFLRWRGSWGSASAFRRRGSGDEIIVPQLAFRLARIGGRESGAQVASRLDAAGMIAQPDSAIELRVTHPQGGAFLLEIRKDQPASNLTLAALRYCGEEDFCHVMAWSDPAFIPKGFPINPQQRGHIAFEYLRDREFHQERVRFDCRAWPRGDASQCLDEHT